MSGDITRKAVVAGAVLCVIGFCWQMAVNMILAGWLETTVTPCRKAGRC